MAGPCEPVVGVVQAAGVVSVNGDIGPAVVLDAADIPSTGPSTVQADLDALAASVGGLIAISSTASLEAAFPNAAGVHTIDKQTIWVSQTGAPITPFAAGGSIVLVNPGTIHTLTGAKVLLSGDVASPLLSGELNVSGLAILNANAGGSDIQCESLAGRLIQLDNIVLLGDNPGVIENCLGGGLFSMQLRPSASGALPLVIDGTNGVPLFFEASAQTPGGVPYTGWRLAATCIISVNMRFDSVGFFGQPGDNMIDIDVGATLPTGPLPTNILGCEFFGCGIKGGANMFAVGGLDHTDIRVLSNQNTGGPTSSFIGDVLADTTVTPTPTPIAQTYSVANTFEVVPTSNGAIAPDDVALTLNTSLSQRHSVQIVLGERVLRYDGPEDARIAAVSWKASADRPGGAAAVVDAQLEYDNGAGWLPLPATRDTITLLSGTPQTMEGRTVLPITDSGLELRLMSRTDTQPTITDWHTLELSKGI